MLNIKIAGQVYSVDNHYSYIESMCRSYQCNEIGIPIAVTEEEILREGMETEGVDSDSDVRPLMYYFETLAILRKIAGKALDWDTLLLHGSAVAVDGEAFIFTASSGTGKSTHTRLWREYFGSRAVMINDDKPMLRFADKEIFVCGSPWNGKHHLDTNTEVPLRAVCILERGKENQIREITAQEAYPMLIQQSFRPDDPSGLAKVLRLLDRLCADTGLFRLSCTMDPNAAVVSYEAMKSKHSQQ